MAERHRADSQRHECQLHDRFCIHQRCGNYYVAVANAYGTATSQAATLTVYVPVTFTSQPAQQVVPFKGTAVFSAAAGG